MPKNIEAATVGNMWTQLSVPIAGDPRNSADIEAIAQRLLDNDNYLAQQVGAENILDQLREVDGSGSGLDADLLDGAHGSGYGRKNGILQEGLNAELLDGLDKYKFIRNTAAFGGSFSIDAILAFHLRGSDGAVQANPGGWVGNKLGTGDYEVEMIGAGAVASAEVLVFLRNTVIKLGQPRNYDFAAGMTNSDPDNTIWVRVWDVNDNPIDADLTIVILNNNSWLGW